MKKIIKCDKDDIIKILAEYFSVNESDVSINIKEETRGSYPYNETVPVVVAEIETPYRESSEEDVSCYFKSPQKMDFPVG